MLESFWKFVGDAVVMIALIIGMAIFPFSEFARGMFVAQSYPMCKSCLILSLGSLAIAVILVLDLFGVHVLPAH